MSDDLFLLEGRMGRRKYIIYVITFFIAYLVVNSILNFAIKYFTSSGEDNVAIFLISTRFTFLVLFNVFIFILSFKRIHDLSILGFAAILCLIPYLQIMLVIILMFVNGTKGNNKYGINLKTNLGSKEDILTLETI